MAVIIADTPDGSVETEMTDLSNSQLAVWVRSGHPEALAEWARRKVGRSGGWLDQASAQLKRRSRG
jgi:hypothetical protein